MRVESRGSLQNTLPGLLDVRGNALTSGTWSNENGNPPNGFTLAFTDLGDSSQPRFDASREINGWLRTRAVANYLAT